MSGRKYDDQSPERRSSMDSEPQDDPTDRSGEDKSSALFPEKQLSKVDVLSSAISSAFASPSRQSSTHTLGSDPLQNVTGIFNNLGIGAPVSADHTDPFLNKSVFVGGNSGAISSGPGAPIGLNDPPGLQFGQRVNTVSNWFYKDPVGNVQGPFSTDQMQDWYSKNFFSEDLPIKREQDILFEPLSNLLLRFGRERPFPSLDESESGMFHQPEPPRFPAIPAYQRADSFTGTGYNPFGGSVLGGAMGVHQMGPSRFNSTPSAGLYGNDFIGGRDIRFGAMDHAVQNHGWGSQHESTGGFGMLRGGPGAFGQNVPDLAFGSLHQTQHQQPQSYNPIQNSFTQFGGAPQFGTQVASSTLDSFVASPTANDTPVTNWQNPGELNHSSLLSPGAANAALGVATESPEQIPQSMKKSPQKSPKALSPALRAPTPEPVAVAAVPSPVVSPVKSPQVLKSPVVEPTPVPEPKVKSKKSKKNIVEEHQPAPAPAVVPEVVEQQKPTIAATPAPWTNKTTPILSLKEIQELEQREFEQKEREKAKKAHAKLMAEAQAIAEQTASGIPVGGAPWTAGQTAKKSLADIMKEEERQRKAVEAASGNAGGVKRYSDSIVPITANVTSAAPSYAKAAPAVVTAVPKATTSGWNVVGKAAAPARPAVSAVPAPAPVVVQAKGPVVSRPAAVSPAADEFIQILLMIPTNEPKTMVSICDDTLGGLTAIDPVKFAEEFMRRRKADVSDPAGYVAGSSGSSNDAGRGFDSGFVTVQKKKGKK
ncbi:hypothetical protein BDR26DRAFT_870035 [Obelidium mucronatum]|nr:hypothetical protein BDR26DRAFT_870035 [Obelidium mucronatum]